MSHKIPDCSRISPTGVHHKCSIFSSIHKANSENPPAKPGRDFKKVQKSCSKIPFSADKKKEIAEYSAEAVWPLRDSPAAAGAPAFQRY
jgi:hypothetical protein